MGWAAVQNPGNLLAMVTAAPCSTFLGNNEPVKARRAAYSALSIGLASTVITAILTFALRYKLPLLFTTWDEAIQVAADVTQVVCFCLVFDGMQLICSGILRGVGRRKRRKKCQAYCKYFGGASDIRAPVMTSYASGCLNYKRE